MKEKLNTLEDINQCLTEKMETLDEMFSGMVVDTFYKMKGVEKIVFYKTPSRLKYYTFFRKDVCWVDYSKLDDRIKYAVDVLSSSDNYVNENILFLK